MNKNRSRQKQGFRRLLGRTATLLLAVSLLPAAPSRGQGPSGGGQAEAWRDAPPTSTGPAVGEKIPSFRAPDQNGRMQDFQSIRGPKGAAIYFNRSVDW